MSRWALPTGGTSRPTFGIRSDAFLQILIRSAPSRFVTLSSKGMTLWLATTTTLICASGGVAADFRQARPGYPVGGADSYGTKMRLVNRGGTRVKARSEVAAGETATRADVTAIT